MKKIAIKSVWLNRAEGPSALCGDVTIADGDIVKQVLDKLCRWGVTVHRGSYDKVDFKVEWENGDEYAGRFDMQHGGTDAGQTFWHSLKSRLELWACKIKPSHFSEQNWANHCKECEENGWKEGSLKMLDEYDLAA